MNKWNSSVEFARDNYILHVVEEGFGPSNSSGKPMITLTYEVHHPDSVQIGDKEYNVAGVKIKTYNVTQSIDGEGNVDAEKTENLATRLEQLYKNHGLPFEGFNPENPTLGFKGKYIHALCSAKVEEQRKNQTPEQKKRGDKGDLIINPITKQPVVRYYPQINEIYGPAEPQANKPY